MYGLFFARRIIQDWAHDEDIVVYLKLFGIMCADDSHIF